MLLTVVYSVLENWEQGEVVEGLGQAGAVGSACQVQTVHQSLDEVVFGQADPLVGPHAVVTEVFLAVQAVRGSGVAFVAGAALWVRKVVGAQQPPVGVPITPAVAPAVVPFALLLGGYHDIKQVAEQKRGRGQGVHAGLGHGHFLVTGGASELQGVSVVSQALQALPAEGVQAGQDVESSGG